MLLALLIDSAGAVVSSDQLIKGLWNEPPRTADSALQVYVSQLRKHFQGQSGLIETRHPGYALFLSDHHCDIAQSQIFRYRAVAAEARGDLSEASVHLARYLDLWAGPTFADVRRTTWLEQIAKVQDEHRANAQQRRIEIDLRLGRHQALVPELYALVARNANQQTLWGYLMLALHRSGRSAEALEVFTEMRGNLVASHGIEPNRELRSLQRRILEDDSGLDDPLLTMN
ncbi:AfsR/SARP family transcriptional regulator [Nocardia sp. NPDC051832]|uniref:AfsR/SARP family transcriptional regulator n=1 Tax=Nocardia sp. NPDC051832 TaxID=3155673 RepID=UPI00341CB4DB